MRLHRWQPTRLLCPWDSPGKNTGVGCRFLLQCMHACMLSRFSRVRLCATPWTAAHQAPLSMGFSRQEHWSGLPFPSPVHACMHAKSLQPCPTLRPHGQQPTRLLCPWDSPGKNTGVGCRLLLHKLQECLLF